MSAPKFDWPACVRALTPARLGQLGNERAYCNGILNWLHERSLIGLHNGCIAFAVHDESGAVIGCHYRNAVGKWFYTKGTPARPLIIGEPHTARQVQVFESQWDALEFCDKTNAHVTDSVAIVITRGAANGASVTGLIGADAEGVAWPQNDPEEKRNAKTGRTPAETWLADVVINAGVTVRVAFSPPEHKDLNDWGRAGATADNYLAAMKAAATIEEGVTQPAPPKGAIAARLNSSNPKVELPGDGRLLSTFAKELAGILKDHGVYQRGGLAFIVNQQRDGLEVVTAQMLRTLAEQHLVCFRIKRAGETALSLDRTMRVEDALGVLCAQQFLARLPALEKVATARLPVMRKDGKIELLPAGYDRESLTLTMPHCCYDEAMPLATAKKVIDNLLREFPFADDKGRSNAVAVAAMVGLYAVGLLPKGALRPMLIYLANAEGAGKTMLAKCAISPVHGLVDTEGAPKDKAEIAKELLTAVIEARFYTLLDNCKGHLDSPHLEAFVTSVRWKGRVLGVSKSFCGDNNVTVFVTGNGCTVSPDIRRRGLFVELFAENERAEDRKFQRILDDAALLAMRAEILAALWAFVREWDAAGRPKASRTHSSFPRWAEIIGGIVEYAGYSCPLETAEIQSATDIDGADMRELVKLLANREPVKFEELVAIARGHGLFERILGSDGDLKAAEKSAFGKLLKKYDRRVFGEGKRFVVDGKGHSRRFYAVAEAKDTHGQQGQHGDSVDPV